MKKIKKLITYLTCLALLVLVPFALAGCGDNSLSAIELNDLMYTSANTLYSTHIDFENFEDITYHWTENSVEKNNIKLEYYNNATDTETVIGTFEDKTQTTAEYFVAIKKNEDSLVAKFTITRTIVENYHDVDADGLLVSESVTTLQSETCKLMPFYVGENLRYGILYESSEKVGSAEAEVTKQYYIYSNAESYENKIFDTVVKEVNERLRDAFFYWALYKTYYSGLNIEATKEGNKVVINSNIVITEIGYNNFEPVKYTVKTKANFVDNKANSAEMDLKTYSKSSSYESNVTFDYTNSAVVETQEGDVVEAGYIQSYNDYVGNIDALPNIGVGIG